MPGGWRGTVFRRKRHSDRTKRNTQIHALSRHAPSRPEGSAPSPHYNGEDEPIELIARISGKRGYLLGPGVMSGKQFGINHKEYGVTSTGVIRFAEITLDNLGIDPHEVRVRLKKTVEKKLNDQLEKDR